MPDFMSYDHDAQARMTKQFLTEIDDRSREGKTNLVIHSLSNNGFSVYQHIVNQVGKLIVRITFWVEKMEHLGS